MNIFCKKLILYIFLLVNLNACQTYMAKVLPNRPDKDFNESLEGASVEFQQGWRDGCEVGMSGGANHFYKMFYRSNKVDGYKITSSADYKTAWSNAFWYCFRDDWVDAKSSIWSATFGGLK